jgi:GT2 family glycosyltransferase
MLRFLFKTRLFRHAKLQGTVLFDSAYYSKKYSICNNVFEHYLNSATTTNPNQLFDVNFYIKNLLFTLPLNYNLFFYFLDHCNIDRSSPHPLFDVGYYLDNYPDVDTQNINALAHYLNNGAAELRRPHILFDPKFYLNAIGDIDERRKAKANPLIHFLEYGGTHGLPPHPLFDSAWYLQQYPDVAQADENPLVHYVCLGFKEGRSPHPLFDAARYLEMNPDVAEAGINPLIHYLVKGANEGRSPHLLFDAAWYLKENPDVATAGENPLLHFVLRGHIENRSPHPLFDTAWYREHYPDVATTGKNPLIHYLTVGVREGRSPHILFDSPGYLRNYPDVSKDGVNPLVHFVKKGASEGRTPHPLFDLPWYLRTYPDVARAGINPLIHFVAKGGREGRWPHALFDPDWYAAGVKGKRLSSIPLIDYLLRAVKDKTDPHPLFDMDFYLFENPKVAEGDQDPLIHFLQSPPVKRLNPHPLFNSAHYLKQYPELEKRDINLLLHYIEHGAQEDPDPHPLFTTAHYRRQTRTLADGQLPLLHYVTRGFREGANPCPIFDNAYYLAAHPDITVDKWTPLAHFWVFGKTQRLAPHPWFDMEYYLRENPDVATSQLNPLLHYYRTGALEGRWCHPKWHSLHVSATMDDEALSIAQARTAAFEHTPLVSIIVPTYNTEPVWLVHLVESLKDQIYENWELCICDDGSARSDTLACIRSLDLPKGKLRFVLTHKNRGISMASNTALGQASGELVAFVDHDDLLTPDALYEVVRVVNEHPDTDVIYTDQDKVDSDGWRSEPFYKPGFSPEYLRGVMYVGHLLVVRRELAMELGGFDPAFDTIQDYEFMLRLSECTDRIRHVAKILYHWRKVPGSYADSLSAKLDNDKLSRLQEAAVNGHLARLGIQAEARRHLHIPHRVMILPHSSGAEPLISVIIPTLGSDHLDSCLKSLFTTSSYKNLDVILVDNDPASGRTEAWAEKYPGVRVIPYAEPFNFARMNNVAAREAKGPLLLLLNDDTEVLEPDSLAAMGMYLKQSDVGAVGSLLLYPDLTVQHAGVVLGFRGTADHVMRGFPKDCDGYAGSLACSREVSAVTAACLMVRKDDYLVVGGMVEDYTVVYQDVDFCLRLRRLGRRNIYTPRSVFLHHESKSRGVVYPMIDRALLRDCFGRCIDGGDPYYNPNFSLERTDYGNS